MYIVAVNFLPDVARDFLKADAKIFWAQLGLESLEAEESCVLEDAMTS